MENKAMKITQQNCTLDATDTRPVWADSAKGSGVTHGNANLSRALGERFCKGVIIFITMIIVIISQASDVSAARLYMPAITAKAGNSVSVPIMIDRLEQIAGIKLILNYDKDVLAFKDGGKTKAADSLMHIINDTQPGRLVIVMAGAKGISGKDVTIFLLNFTVRKGRPEVKNTRIDIQEVQLMNENLKELKAETGAGLINIE